ncbi:MAG: metallophosphoesterase [Lachnospiraceae bacterium]|jgi:DNA repair exonuclease SbcCD nuclease subunit|nr:metallophosphoesterase [Lachnospiraceae bacterium]
MKFIHTGDVHWGVIPDCDKPWGLERAQAVKDTFGRIIQLAKQEEVDFLFITGDLFHSQPLEQDLKDLNHLFSSIPGTRVAIIAGSFDRVTGSSALHSFTWAPNVTYFLDEAPTGVYFPEINTEVHGFSYHSSEITDPVLDDVKAPFDGRIHILLAYAGDDLHVPIQTESLSDSGFTYIALGSRHKYELLKNRAIAYCGSPEPLGKAELGEHGVVLGQIHPRSFAVTALDFIPMAKLAYVPFAVHISPQTTNKELLDTVMGSVKARGLQNIYRLRITGLRRSDTTFNLQPIMSNLRIVDVIDETEPQYDFSELVREHPDDVIGYYIQKFQKPDASPIEKKALYYGIHALLQTIEERR